MQYQVEKAAVLDLALTLPAMSLMESRLMTVQSNLSIFVLKELIVRPSNKMH
jgi:hypothetical protein